MARIVPPLLCLALGACGLERDWKAWQDLAAAASDATSATGTASTDTTTILSTSTDTTDAEAASASTDTTADPDASTAPASDATTTTGTTDTTTATTGPVSVCGDGVVDGDEECDDPGDTACFKCYRDRLVFVSSKFDFRGDFALLPQNLDYWCNSLAADAGLLGPDKKKRYKPWVSTSAGSPAERLHHSKGRYVLRNGLVFALNWDALVAGQILNPLNVDEHSQTRNVPVWTDAAPDGNAMPGEHCNDWTSDSLTLWAHFGYSAALDGNWTLYTGEGDNPTLCGDNAAIYCFESP